MFRSALALALSLSMPVYAHAQPQPSEDEGPPPAGTPSGTTLPTTKPRPLPPPTQPSRPELPPGAVLVPLHGSVESTNYPHDEWVSRRPKTGVLVAGVALLLGGYLGDVGFTYGYNHQPAGTSLIPVAGPWLQLGQHVGLSGPPIDTGLPDSDARAQKTVDDANRDLRALARSGEVISGLMQAAGVVMIVVGAALKRRARANPAHEAPRKRVYPAMQNGSLSLRF
ncbi:MAG: hypothetical protein ABI321_18420 [Polyangia bacterium]